MTGLCARVREVLILGRIGRPLVTEPPGARGLEPEDPRDCGPLGPGEWVVDDRQTHAKTWRVTARYGEAADAPGAFAVWLDDPAGALATSAGALAAALLMVPLGYWGPHGRKEWEWHPLAGLPARHSWTTAHGGVLKDTCP